MAGEINKAVQWAIEIANDDSYAYVWGGWGKSDGGYDCSHFVITAYEQAGVLVKSGGATYTGDMKNVFLNKGFADVTNSCNLSNGNGLKRGDVLLNESHHAALVQEDGGTTVEARGKNYGIVDNVSYRNYPWDCVLRYTRDISGGSSGEKTYTDFPKYSLSDSAIKDIATCITGEQGGDDVLACRQEASQMANLNEVTYGRSNTESAIIKTIHGGWYSSNSWKRGCTQTAIDAVKFVLVEGKRVLPRYVTEHDTFPLDILNAKSRSSYQKGDSVSNKYGSNYKFYCFFGSNSDKDIAGYFSKDYEKYKSDIPWTEGADDSTDSTEGDSTESDTKEITSSRRVSYVGNSVDYRNNPLFDRKLNGTTNVELYIVVQSGKIYKPVLCDSITWETETYGSPAQLEFTVVKDGNISFNEGDQVIFKYKAKPVFFGFVFEKTRASMHHIQVKAFDQTRYFQNTDCYVYQDCTATELVKNICDDYKIVCGTLEDTGIQLPLTVCDNKSVFKIIEDALDYTVAQGGNRFVLWDDFGKIMLAPKYWYKKNYAVCNTTAQDFNYTSSINEGTYTRVKLYYDNDQTGEREVYIHDASGDYPAWGVLQYCDTLDEGEDGVAKAAELIKITTNQTRSLDIKNAFGDVDVRGGTQVYVDLDLGDLVQQAYMECYSAKHTFKDGEHFMDLHLIGGQFI